MRQPNPLAGNSMRASKFVTLRLEQAKSTTRLTDMEERLVTSLMGTRLATSRYAAATRQPISCISWAEEGMPALAVLILEDAAAERQRAPREDSPVASDVSMQTYVSRISVDIDINNPPLSPKRARPTPIRLTPPPPDLPAVPGPRPRQIKRLPRRAIPLPRLLLSANPDEAEQAVPASPPPKRARQLSSDVERSRSDRSRARPAAPEAALPPRPQALPKRRR